MGIREVLINGAQLSGFEKKVLLELSKLKAGETITYGELAKRVGKPKAARAIGNAMHRNPFPVIVPCHRVVARNGIGGYGHGILAKRILLGIERLL